VAYSRHALNQINKNYFTKYQPTNGGPRRVLFRTQPDVLFLTLQNETMTTTPSPPDTEEEEDEEEDRSYTQRFKDRGTSHRHRTGLG